MGFPTVLASLLYPPVCPLCRSGGSDHEAGPLCHSCRTRLEPDGPPDRSQRGVRLSGAPWRYTGALTQAVRQFKYHRRWRIGRWLAGDMEALVRRAFPLDDIDLIVPMPSHWLRRRLRGFDAPGELARALSRRLGKRCDPRLLRRPRRTASQTRLPWPKRLRNVEGAFTARPRLAAQRAVLLVDDVLTSGATARAAALALRQAGARAVYVVTAARTPSA